MVFRYVLFGLCYTTWSRVQSRKYVHIKPDKFEHATFSPDTASVHTKPDKFENGIFVAKTDKMFSVHIIEVFEEIATEIIWLLSRKRFQKVPFSPSTLTHL